MLKLGERFGVSRSNAQIAISPVIRDLIQTKYRRHAALIPNGVEVLELSQDIDLITNLNVQAGKYFLQVSRLVPEKRQLDLIAAYRAALPIPWKLVLVGRVTEDSYCKDVIKAASSVGAVLPGFLTGNALRQIFSHAGAFILPSSHEGLPIALLEALSFGLPVIASDIPSNRAIGLDDDRYFTLGDIEALTEKLKLLASATDSPEARASRRTWVAVQFDWNRIAKQTYDLFKSTVHSNP
jgi:glycosyltransferase involved in cell wall biosynthesis